MRVLGDAPSHLTLVWYAYRSKLELATEPEQKENPATATESDTPNILFLGEVPKKTLLIAMLL